MSFTAETVEQIIARLSQDPPTGDNANATPQTNKPFAVSMGGQNVTVNSPEELQGYISKNEEGVRQAFLQQQQQVQALVAEVEKLQKQQKTRVNLGEPTPDVSIDPDQFVHDIVNGKPVDAVTRAFNASPEIKAQLNKMANLEQKLALSEFSQRHPFYANPQVIGFLDQIRERVGLGNSVEHYEAAAALAIQNGRLPDERVLRAQQQLALSQQLAAQNQSQYQNGYSQPQQPQNQIPYNPAPGMANVNIPMAAGYGYNSPAYLPPPASPSNSTSYPNALESALALSNAGKLKGEDLIQVIQSLQPKT